tara:strand:+ start:57 stop:1013 length:957 start_codon:yes stop_codon:yes gene_type:complete
MYKVAIIEKIHNDGIELLKKNSNFEYEILTDVSEKNLIKRLPEFDACTLRVSKLDSEILKHCQRLKVISRHGVGYDNVDLDYIKKNNIRLLITAKANAVAVAEHVLALILSISKSIKEYDNEVRIGNFKKNSHKIQTIELYNKEILIAGFGRIGKALIKRCLNFEMKVKIYDPYVDKKVIKENGGEKVENFDEAIRSCDFLSLHMPLTKETKNILNYDKIKKMKKEAILINTARGGIINENDLDKALKDRLIFGAGLDVFVNEPIEKDSVLLKNNKIILSPHSATFTDECTSRMAIETTKNIIDFFDNKIQKEMMVKL